MYMYIYTFSCEASKTVFSVVPRPCSWPVGGGAAQLRVLDLDLGGETGPTHIQEFVVCLREGLPACRSEQWPAMFPSATWSSQKSTNCYWKASFSGNGKRLERTHALSWWARQASNSWTAVQSLLALISREYTHNLSGTRTCIYIVYLYLACQHNNMHVVYVRVHVARIREKCHHPL